jgi:aminomuconate-semialdehyde/2-hydroxymuconate-6-semialdehyde dehydrogenase
MISIMLHAHIIGLTDCPEALYVCLSVSLVRAVDIPRAVENFRFFASQMRQDETPCHQMADAINYTHRAPVGVAVLITPWNLPIYLLSWKVAPALVCGNTVRS